MTTLTMPALEPAPSLLDLLHPAVFSLRDVLVSYAGQPAVRDITMDIPERRITAFIGPSGCGKSTPLRSLNRMNDLIPTARVEGRVLYHGEDLYGPRVDPVEVRKRIGMVFQKPNPFPKSIYDNIAFGPRVLGVKGDMDERGARAAPGRCGTRSRTASRRTPSASGGQQQRLCIALPGDRARRDPDGRAVLGARPDLHRAHRELMLELVENYSIVIVTHNMQQAARVSSKTAFLTVELDATERNRTGRVAEYDDTERIFTNLRDPRTEACEREGRVGAALAHRAGRRLLGQSGERGGGRAPRRPRCPSPRRAPAPRGRPRPPPRGASRRAAPRPGRARRRPELDAVGTRGQLDRGARRPLGLLGPSGAGPEPGAHSSTGSARRGRRETRWPARPPRSARPPRRAPERARPRPAARRSWAGGGCRRPPPAPRSPRSCRSAAAGSPASGSTIPLTCVERATFMLSPRSSSVARARSHSSRAGSKRPRRACEIASR